MIKISYDPKYGDIDVGTKIPVLVGDFHFNYVITKVLSKENRGLYIEGTFEYYIETSLLG